MSQIVNFENEFGSLQVSLITEFMPVGKISREIPEVSGNMFDLNTAEKIALITGNQKVQICMCYPLNELGYMVYHRNSQEAAVCKVDSIQFSCKVPPAEQIELMARGELGFTQPLHRGQGRPEIHAIVREPLTADELESCWYCQHCNAPMREEEDGFVDPQSRVSYCSESCRDDHAAEGWYS